MTVVRPASLDDVDQLVSMYEWLFAPPGSRPSRWDPQGAAVALGRAVSSGKAVVLVAALDGELVGFCTA